MRFLGTLGSMLLPYDAAPTLLVCGGLLWMLSLRKLAFLLLGIGVSLLISPLFKPLIAAMPLKFLLLAAVCIFFFLTARFWRGVLVHAFAIILADLMRWLFSSRVGLGFLATLAVGSYLWFRFT